MKLIKVKNGLLEAENFFLASSFSDFAMDSNVSRDISTGKLKLMSNNKIERNFNYNEFVIEMEKENFNSMGIDDYSALYLSNGSFTFGIRDNKQNEQCKYWKILKQDNYVQAYSSTDGINYNHIGGMAFEDPLTKQGFMKYGAEDFILNNYKVYSSPYVVIQNFPEGTVCEFYSMDNTLLKTRVFDANMECKVFLDSAVEGYFIFKDSLGSTIYTTTNFNLNYGDVYIISPYNFEVDYHGSIVNNINPVLLQDLEELLTIRNVGDKDYIGVVVGAQTSSDDLIELSLDGVSYSSTVTINIAMGESKGVYVKITKNVNNHSFKVRDFQLIINE